jgi:hypothetical protein
VVPNTLETEGAEGAEGAEGESNLLLENTFYKHIQQNFIDNIG